MFKYDASLYEFVDLCDFHHIIWAKENLEFIMFHNTMCHVYLLHNCPFNNETMGHVQNNVWFDINVGLVQPYCLQWFLDSFVQLSFFIGLCVF